MRLVDQDYIKVEYYADSRYTKSDEQFTHIKEISTFTNHVSVKCKCSY